MTILAPRIDNATRRQALTGSAALLALTACSRPSADDLPTHSVTGDFGPVRIPTDPRRVVAATGADADIALVLGLPLVAAPGARGAANRPFPPYQPAEKLRGVTRFGIYPDLQLEKVSAARPDCILNGGNTLPQYHKGLSPIAPTLSYSRQLFADWRAGLRHVAHAFGSGLRAERFIERYERRVTDLRKQMRARFGKARVAMIYPAGPAQFTVYAKGAQTLRTMHECGLPLAPVTPDGFDQHRTYSAEQVTALNEVDILLLFLDVDTEDPDASTLERNHSAYDTITASPLWAKLPAVRSGQVHEVPAELAYASPLTATANLDLIRDSLL